MHKSSRDSSRPRLMDKLVSFFAMIGLLVVAVTLTPIVSWWGGMLGGRWNNPHGDVLIVLGGAVGEQGLMGEGSYLRSKYAVLAYRRESFRTVVVSGGGIPTPVSIVMRDFLVCEGVPRDAILTETGSMSTREDALYTKKILEGIPGTKVLMTSDYHMFRAYRAFRKAGVEVLPRPVPDVRRRATTWKGRWPAFLDLVQETAKIGYYFARGWI